GFLGKRSELSFSPAGEKAGSPSAGPAARARWASWNRRGLLLPPMFRPEGSLRRGEAGDGDPEGRARHVVEADLLAELDRSRIAAVLAADAKLQGGAGLAPALGREA